MAREGRVKYKLRDRNRALKMRSHRAPVRMLKAPSLSRIHSSQVTMLEE